MRRRVAVTGVGLVSCLGHDVASVARRLRDGASGLRAMPEWREYGLKSLVAGAIDGLEGKKKAAAIPKTLLWGMPEYALYCSLSALDAVADAGLEEEDLRRQRTACIVGSSGIDGMAAYKAADHTLSHRVRRVDPYTSIRGMSSAASAFVANLLKIRGRSYSISSACATSAHDVGHAYELIRDGVVDLALAGGGDEVSELTAGTFQALRIALSTAYNDRPETASRPYDAGRDGFVLAAGAGIVVLEEMERARARGATIRAEIAGYGANSDGYDLLLPEPEGTMAAECMRQAIADAGVEPGNVDYVNTHGTSTVAGDIAEVVAMERVFGKSLPAFSSTKSLCGHSLGAAGVHELIHCIAMVEGGFIAPSINIEELDPRFEGMPIVRETVERRLDRALSNSFGFGGTNASILVARAG